MTTPHDPDPRLADKLEQLTWWSHGVLQDFGVRVQQEPDAVTSEAIVSSPSLCRRALGDLLPGLRQVRSGTPAECVEDTRARNAVTRCSANTWEDLSTYSADRLGTWPNIGRKSVTEIVRGALRAWSEIDSPGSPESPEEANPETGESRNRAVEPLLLAQELLEQLCAEGYRAGAVDLREAIDLANAGEGGAQAWEQICGLRLGEALGMDEGLDPAWRALLRFDQRELRVLEARTFTTGSAATLAALGDELGCTRERIRQIEDRVKKQVAQRRASAHECLPIEHAAARLRRVLGSAVTETTMQSALEGVVPNGDDDAELRRGFLVTLAGPYRLSDGFWQRGAPLNDLKSALARSSEEPLTDDDVDQALATAGVAQLERAALAAALPLHRFDERLLVWTGSLADKAARLLRVHGEPMSREQLHLAMGHEEVNLRSMLVQIQGDDRFRRRGRDSYGLAAWGGEEYTTIADEIEQAIERRGGRAMVEEIVSELVELFGVSAQSVRTYAASRRFRRQPDGTLVAAGDGHTDNRAIRMPSELDRDLVRHGDVWTVRVVVDRDVLRGSGRPVRNAIAQAAGVWPGDARTIELQVASLVIGWRGNQPALGSCRALVDALGCVDGDLLFVPLQDGQEAFAVPQSDVMNAAGIERVALELGLPAGAQIDEIASVVGLSPDASVADMRARLRARRQDDLALLLPEEKGQDDALLDELMGLGE